MAGQLQNDSNLIKRAIVLDGLRAIYLTQHKFDRFLKEDSYACGYREGFEDALLSIAQMVGVSDEFEAMRQQQLSSFQVKNLPIYNPNSNGK